MKYGLIRAAAGLLIVGFALVGMLITWPFYLAGWV